MGRFAPSPPAPGSSLLAQAMQRPTMGADGPSRCPDPRGAGRRALRWSRRGHPARPVQRRMEFSSSLDKFRSHVANSPIRLGPYSGPQPPPGAPGRTGRGAPTPPVGCQTAPPPPRPLPPARPLFRRRGAGSRRRAAACLGDVPRAAAQRRHGGHLDPGRRPPAHRLRHLRRGPPPPLRQTPLPAYRLPFHPS